MNSQGQLNTQPSNLQLKVRLPQLGILLQRELLHSAAAPGTRWLSYTYGGQRSATQQYWILIDLQIIYTYNKHLCKVIHKFACIMTIDWI